MGPRYYHWTWATPTAAMLHWLAFQYAPELELGKQAAASHHSSVRLVLVNPSSPATDTMNLGAKPEPLSTEVDQTIDQPQKSEKPRPIPVIKEPQKKAVSSRVTTQPQSKPRPEIAEEKAMSVPNKVEEKLLEPDLLNSLNPVEEQTEMDPVATEISSTEDLAKPVPRSGSVSSGQNKTVNGADSSTPANSATPVDRVGDKALASYSAELVKWLNKHKRYPKRAKRKNQQGSVKVEFTVNRSGQILEFNIIKSSGYHALDEAVQKMIRKANPVPAMPSGINLDRMTFTLPIDFLIT